MRDRTRITLRLGAGLLAAGWLLAAAAAAAPRWPRVQRISHGDYVVEEAAVQFLLQARGYKKVGVEGIFDAETEKAVREFQRARRLKPTGKVDSATWEALVVTVREGSRGPAVRGAQTLLGMVSEGGRSPYEVPVTGTFDAKTKEAVRRFQAKRRLPANGVVGPETWCLLAGGSLR